MVDIFHFVIGLKKCDKITMISTELCVFVVVLKSGERSGCSLDIVEAQLF